MAGQGHQQGMERRLERRIHQERMGALRMNGLCQIQGLRTTYVEIYLMLRISLLTRALRSA